MTKPLKEYGVFIDTAFNQVARIGTATQYDNLCFVFKLYALPVDGQKVILTPINSKQNVIKLEVVKDA